MHFIGFIYLLQLFVLFLLFSIFSAFYNLTNSILILRTLYLFWFLKKFFIKKLEKRRFALCYKNYQTLL